MKLFKFCYRRDSKKLWHNWQFALWERQVWEVGYGSAKRCKEKHWLIIMNNDPKSMPFIASFCKAGSGFAKLLDPIDRLLIIQVLLGALHFFFHNHIGAWIIIRKGTAHSQRMYHKWNKHVFFTYFKGFLDVISHFYFMCIIFWKIV